MPRYTFNHGLCRPSIITLCILLFTVFAKSQVITTIAGNGTPGFSGDGGISTHAQLNTPLALCTDASGNIYFTDFGNQRIRKIDGATGIITTIAGNGTAGFSGDGGPAINAQVNGPFRMCIKNTNLYFSDYNNLRVRKINLATGIITTVAGDGTENYIDGALARYSGMLPGGLALDAAGNLYIAQHMGAQVTFTTNIISKIDMSTGVITTVAGTGTFGFTGDNGAATHAQLNNPGSLSFDVSGNLYINDQGNKRIRKLNIATGIITTVAGNGGINYTLPDVEIATRYCFKNPTDVYVDANSNLIVVDENNDKIHQVYMNTGVITTIAGNGFSGIGQDCVYATTTSIGDCAGAVKDAAGNLYFTDLMYHRIRKVTPSLDFQVSVNAMTVCAGSPVTFTAQDPHIGGAYTYQWSVNNVPTGTNKSVFTTTPLNDSDIVMCKLTSTKNTTCGLKTILYSNPVIIHVNPSIPLSVTIATATNAVCKGVTVTFTASAVNAGTNPSFQWLVNGIKTGSGTTNFSSSSLADNDIVTCVVIADKDQGCLIKDQMTSNAVIMQIATPVVPTITINASDKSICPGEPVTLTAKVQNAGDSPSYQWIVNGINTGSNNPTYKNSDWQNGDNIYCQLTANNLVCPTAPVLSNTEIITVNPAPVINTAFTDTIIFPHQQVQLKVSLGNNTKSYTWAPADKLVNAALLEPTTIPVTQTITYKLRATTTDGCSATKEVSVYLFTNLNLPAAFTPNGDGKNDLFRIPRGVTVTLKEFSVFNRWGKKIFTTKDAIKGWDGTYNGYPAEAGVYVYVISATSSNGDISTKGTVTLLR